MMALLVSRQSSGRLQCRELPGAGDGDAKFSDRLVTPVEVGGVPESEDGCGREAGEVLAVGGEGFSDADEQRVFRLGVL